MGAESLAEQARIINEVDAFRMRKTFSVLSIPYLQQGESMLYLCYSLLCIMATEYTSGGGPTLWGDDANKNVC